MLHVFHHPEHCLDLFYCIVQSQFDIVEVLLRYFVCHPRMFIYLLDCDALLWISLQHFFYQIFSTVWNFRPIRLVKLNRPLFYLFLQVNRIFGLKWRISAHEHVQYDSDGPDIDSSPIFFSLENLRSHIQGSADGSGHEGLISDDLGDSKVNYFEYFHPFLVSIHNVFRLQISMNDSWLVQVSDCINNW